MEEGCHKFIPTSILYREENPYEKKSCYFCNLFSVNSYSTKDAKVDQAKPCKPFLFYFRRTWCQIK